MLSLRSIRAFSSSSTRSAFAKMTLLGTVGSVNQRETKDGLPFISYSLAVNRYNPATEESTPDWFNVSVFDDKQVKAFSSFLRPGTQLYVEADVKQRQVESNGETRVYTSLNQTKYDVVRFSKKSEDAEGEVEQE